MTRIPVDLTAPIACTATRAEIPTRIDQIAHLRRRLRHLDRTTGGLVLHFAADPELRDLLERFVANEKGCCQFWGFEITLSAQELTLDWAGPPGAQAFLDELADFLLSDEALTALSGLL